MYMGILNMKTSVKFGVAALAAAVASVTQGAEVYSKDGTSLAIGGRIEAAYVTGDNGSAGNKDHTIRNQMRLNIKGRSKINDSVTAFGFTEWQQDNRGNSSNAQNMKVRDQYVGLDFGDYGQLQAGRYLTNIYYLAEPTDIFEEISCIGSESGSSRSSGKFRYTYENYGFHAAAEFQSAVNNVPIDHLEDEHNIDAGYSLTLGYTTPSVGFGPIEIRAGYEYQRYQDDYGDTHDDFSNSKSYGAALTWGEYGAGLYLAADYTVRDFSVRDDGNDFKMQGVEVAASYGTDFGLILAAAYEWQRYNPDQGKSADESVAIAQIQYKFNPNFKVWIEGAWDLDTDKNFGKDVNGNGGDRADKEVKGDSYSIAARYNF